MITTIIGIKIQGIVRMWGLKKASTETNIKHGEAIPAEKNLR